MAHTLVVSPPTQHLSNLLPPPLTPPSPHPPSPPNLGRMILELVRMGKLYDFTNCYGIVCITFYLLDCDEVSKIKAVAAFTCN